MHAPLVYIPLAIEWVILITAFMPKLLAGMFHNSPRFGLALWFTYLTSTIAASLFAIILSIWAGVIIFQSTWGVDSIQLELFNTIGLWALVAATGVLIAVINLKTEPLLVNASTSKKDLLVSSRRIGEFQGVPLLEIAFPAPLAFVATLEGKPNIVISNSAQQELSETEISAMLWHELGHVRGRHQLLRAIARTVALFTPMFSASKLFVQETEQLTELMADKFAKRHVGEPELQSARAKFLE